MIRAEEASAFTLDLAALDRALARERPRLVYVCSPANPTGTLVDEEGLSALARDHAGVTFLLDQAFCALSERPESLARPFPDNVVCVRSMTKEHAIPGARVGYALCAAPLAAGLERARPPWSTSSIAQAAAIAGIDDGAFVAESCARALADRRRLVDRLRSAGLAPLPTSTLFFLLPVPDAARARAALLASARVLVRDCASFGLPGMIRVCARPRHEEERLVSALVQELRPCSPAPS
jgi:histidinol-phosphate/aromatic aminotransferase/cobyric acid decarboxylase-like protein